MLPWGLAPGVLPWVPEEVSQLSPAQGARVSLLWVWWVILFFWQLLFVPTWRWVCLCARLR